MRASIAFTAALSIWLVACNRTQSAEQKLTSPSAPKPPAVVTTPTAPSPSTPANLPSTASPLESPSFQPVVDYWIVIDSNVFCREKPGALPLSTRVPLGAIVDDGYAVDGVVWHDAYHQRQGECFVEGTHTTLLPRRDPTPALVVALDHMLTLKDLRLDDYVNVDNLLAGSLTRYDSMIPNAVSESGLLQFRRLQLAMALARSNIVNPDDPNPLARSWFWAHRDLIQPHPIDPSWVVDAKPLWALYEQHKTEPWVDELAWVASQQSWNADECYSDCALSNILYLGPAQYWIRQPNGAHLAEALTRAQGIAKYAADGACFDDSRKPDDDYYVPPDIVKTIRDSLKLVASPAKQPILDSLNKVEQNCGR